MMRPRAAEKGIVRVIHPGRYVEILREPITAGEVMRKNPRHCLTRTDVFKFPWIVIKPDLVLPPGKVFFLVPNRTVYDLMKLEKHRSQSRQRTFTDYKTRVIPLKDIPSSSSSPPKAFAGMTPKHQGHNTRNVSRQNDKKADNSRARSYEINNLQRSEKDRVEESATQYWLDRRNKYKEFLRHLESEVENSAVNSDASHDHESVSEGKPNRAITCSDHRASTSRHHHQRDNSKVEVALKSCLKKPDSDRKWLGLRVSFALPLPSKDRDRQSSANMRRNRFPECLYL